MAIRKWAIPAAAAAFLFSACEPVSGPGASGAGANADLKVLAAKVHYLTPPDPQRAADDHSAGGGLEKRSTGACDLEGESVSESTGISATGGVETFIDTSRSYTPSGSLVCDIEDVTAWTTTSSYSRNDEMESWTRVRLDIPAWGTADYLLKMSGSGEVRYFSGYELSIESMDITIGPSAVTTFSMVLGLEGGYEVPLSLNQALDWSGESEPDPSEPVMSGPILKGGTVMGRFELMADDRVIIRDADGGIVRAP
ncbi:MAG: hypothetical protein JWP91_2165 [Fibrobacteres bacterium]|nr:hypothetical protein [Fibrobacterota bacterium]